MKYISSNNVEKSTVSLIKFTINRKIFDKMKENKSNGSKNSNYLKIEMVN